MDKIKKINTKINLIRHELELGADLNKNLINMIMQANRSTKSKKYVHHGLKNNHC